MHAVPKMGPPGGPIFGTVFRFIFAKFFASGLKKRNVLVSTETLWLMATGKATVQQFLPDLEAKMNEFLAEWIVTLLSPATQIVKARASHLTFMFVKEYWFREFYLGLKVTASLGREESYTRIIDGQVRCITQEHIQKRGQLIWNVSSRSLSQHG